MGLLIALAAAVLGLGYFALDKFVPSKHPGADTASSASNGQANDLGTGQLLEGEPVDALATFRKIGLGGLTCGATHVTRHCCVN